MLKGSEFQGNAPNKSSSEGAGANTVPHSRYLQEIQSRDTRINELETKLEEMRAKVKAL